MKLEELQKQFECPDAKQRAMPFWAWNGDLKEEELLRQIEMCIRDRYYTTLIFVCEADN